MAFVITTLTQRKKTQDLHRDRVVSARPSSSERLETKNGPESDLPCRSLTIGRYIVIRTKFAVYKSGFTWVFGAIAGSDC